MPTAKLTSKGQLVIPQPVRQHLDLQPGDRVDFLIQDDGEVIVRPAVSDVRALKGILPKPARPVSIEDMDRAVRKRGSGR
ncbi:MAG: AbrB/MazE/SpoVT family DNA-binding domain-containing protein [Candidatus Latescibacteria bacterium]|jgi:AbrB family looped-hinge helix DNA binding protein|nr:AbrB family transcriptional regulator [Gemmatimonadaceae bacterium]MDP6018267.1 AbrB/MazE/SpoVT family DNA-binding domain-containing protein [Candidatus Latescibacterota bacterium]MDP7447893.1 AbrB/MazE/SpoVT family DNA-binding domain-containing protein [Candidatus Latescibacterota bacterium]HJP34135.1 AbrB/MazE/SpoVT family DNA-binding domain-containing protein [Candidatus Latescibacterota bacterium]